MLLALFGDREYRIGRGEVAESRVEVPAFLAFLFASSVIVLFFYLITYNPSYTIVAGVSLFVFCCTLVKVEVGVALLVIAMVLSPEIDAGPVGMGRRNLSLRFDDVLIVLVFLGVLARQAWEGKPLLWRPSPINAAIVLYYGVAILSTLRAWQLSLGYWDKQVAFLVVVKMAEFYMVFFLVGNAIRNLDQVRWQLLVFLAASLCVSFYGIWLTGSTARISAPFETGGSEPNTLGGYLVIVMMVSGALFTQAPDLKRKVLAACVFALTLWPFLYTLSRASYLALIVGLIALGFKSRWFSIIVMTVLILLCSSVLMPEEVKDRVNYTFQRGSGKEITIGGKETGLQVDKSTYERIYVWQKVRHNLRVWPWLGGGVAWGNVLDSQYARVIIETGLLGLAAFLFMQWRILRTTSQAFRWTEDWVGRAVGLAGCAATIAMIVHSLGTITFLVVRIMEPYWFLIALGVVARSTAIEEYLRKREETEAENETPTKESLPAQGAA
ncbi:MAG: hypothetical protein R6V12_04110 [Candidatus Hydrogenedentota bacterium]